RYGRCSFLVQQLIVLVNPAQYASMARRQEYLPGRHLIELDIKKGHRLALLLEVLDVLVGHGCRDVAEQKAGFVRPDREIALLRVGMEGNCLAVDAVETASPHLLHDKGFHLFEKAVATVAGVDNGLGRFGHLVASLTEIETEVADDLTLGSD